LLPFSPSATPTPHEPGTLKILPVPTAVPVIIGQLNSQNADYVMQTLRTAAALCLQQQAHAIVTGPVHKAIINQAKIHFTGHTEFFAHYCNVPHTVMLFVVDSLKVALATTHLPLSAVPAAVTRNALHTTLITLHAGLKTHFAIPSPRILVCGLNPHAGENGYLGHEEKEIIEPLLKACQEEGYDFQGPFAADTVFTPQQLAKGDVVLAMYHDQALPLVKYLGFGHAVNVTLGLPFIRTSVDHGTALDVAGTGRADPGSLQAAIELALRLR